MVPASLSAPLTHIEKRPEPINNEPPVKFIPGDGSEGFSARAKGPIRGALEPNPLEGSSLGDSIEELEPEIAALFGEAGFAQTVENENKQPKAKPKTDTESLLMN